jgi:nicotinate-nucleotide--dimethylbenzimidazole phosphoribosyltransferase
MPFIIRRKLYPEENLNSSDHAPVPVYDATSVYDATPDPTLVITEIIEPAAPEPIEVSAPVVPEPVVAPSPVIPEPVAVPEPVVAPSPVIPEPVAVPEPVVAPSPVVPEPITVSAPVTQTPVSVFSHPSMAEKKQKFLAFLAKRH